MASGTKGPTPKAVAGAPHPASVVDSSSPLVAITLTVRVEPVPCPAAHPGAEIGAGWRGWSRPFARVGVLVGVVLAVLLAAITCCAVLSSGSNRPPSMPTQLTGVPVGPVNTASAVVANTVGTLGGPVVGRSAWAVVHGAPWAVTELLAPAQGGPEAGNGTATLLTILTNIQNWVLSLLVGLATLFVTIAGARYLLAGGDPGEVEAAKRALKSAAIGYTIAALATVLVSILRGLVGA